MHPENLSLLPGLIIRSADINIQYVVLFLAHLLEAKPVLPTDYILKCIICWVSLLKT